MRLTYLPMTALVLLVLTMLCRGMGYIYSTMATDIAYSEVTVSIMGILVEGLTILRTVAGYCGILYAMWRWERNGESRYRCGGAVTLTVLAKPEPPQTGDASRPLLWLTLLGASLLGMVMLRRRRA